MRILRALPLIALTFLIALASCAEEDVPEPGQPEAAQYVAPGTANLDMVAVPGGSFLMGSGDTDPDAVFNELPAQTVYVDPFWIARTEVTNAQYRKCV